MSSNVILPIFCRKLEFSFSRIEFGGFRDLVLILPIIVHVDDFRSPATSFYVLVERSESWFASHWVVLPALAVFSSFCLFCFQFLATSFPVLDKRPKSSLVSLDLAMALSSRVPSSAIRFLSCDS